MNSQERLDSLEQYLYGDAEPSADTGPAKAPAGQGGVFDRGVLWQESRGRQFDSSGKPLTSKAGAIGIAQVMPATAPEAARLAGLEWDENRYRNDANYNAALGRAYFDKQLSEFGDEAKALAAYNAGPGATRKAIQLASADGNPSSWLSYLPAETRDYVPKIMGKVYGGGGETRPKPSMTPAATGAEVKPAGRTSTRALDLFLPPTEPADSGSKDQATRLTGLDKISAYLGYGDDAPRLTSVAPEANAQDAGLGDAVSGGFKRGFAQSKGLLYGAAALIDRTLKGGEESDFQRDMMERYARSMREGQDATRANQSFTDAITSGDPKSIVGWAADSAGYLGYQVAESLLTGGLGALVGKQIGKQAVKEIATGMVQKELTKLGAEEAAKLAAGQAAKVLTKEELEKQALQRVIKTISESTAATAMFANNWRQEAGSIYGDAMEESGRTGEEPDLSRIWLSSLAAAGVDTAADVAAARGILGRDGSSAKTFMGRAATQVPRQMAIQGGTEYGQTGLEYWGAKKDFFTPEGQKEGVDSAAVGALGGAPAGLGASVHRISPTGHGDQQQDPLSATKAAAAQPNSPLSRASLAGQDLAAQTQATAQAQDVDPITQRVLEIEDLARQSGLLDRLRSLGIEGMGANDFLSALQTARNTKLDQRTPLIREEALQSLERMLDPLRAPGAFEAGQQWRSMGRDDGDGLAAQRQRQESALASAKEVGRQWQDLGVTQPQEDLAAQRSQEQLDRVRDAGQAWQSLQDGMTPQGETSFRAPMSGPVGETSRLDAAPAALKMVPAPKVSVPTDGPGTSQVRKRKAELGALVAQGFDTLSQDASGADVLVNQKTGEAHALPLAFDRRLAKDAIRDLVRSAADRSPNSPNNDLPSSTPAQNKAGNYPKPQVALNGFKIRIENPKGSTRSGSDPGGKAWSVTMGSDYGYIDGTKAADGDGVDVYVGDNPEAPGIFVIDQVNPDGTFDEPKVVMGVRDEAHARQTYLSNYEPGWAGLGAITPMSREQFDGWLKNGGPLKPTAQGVAYDSRKTTGENHARPQSVGNPEAADRPTGPAHPAQNPVAGEPAQASGQGVLRDAPAEGGSGAEGSARPVGRAREAIARLKSAQEGLDRQVDIREPDPSDPRLKAFEPLADAIEKVFGHRPVAVIATGPGAFDGVQFGGDYFVNLDAAEMPIPETIAHEFGHTQEGKPRIKALEDAMFALVPQAQRQRYYDYLVRTGQVSSARYADASPQDLAKLQSELVRDFMGKRFADKAWLQRLAKEKPAQFGEFVQEWIRLLGDLIQEFKGSLKRATEKDVDALMRGHLAELERMKSIAVEVAAEWKKANAAPAVGPSSSKPSAPVTRRVGNRLVRRLETGDFKDVGAAKPLLSEMVPSFTVSFGEASVDERDASAANSIMEEQGAKFRFNVSDILPKDQSERLINNLKSTGYQDLDAEVEVGGANGAVEKLNARSVLSEMDRRQEALEHVRSCLL